jgi:midasin (ATPase involved in ribosome maturation)
MAVKISTPHKKSTATTIVTETVTVTNPTTNRTLPNDLVSHVTTIMDKTTAGVDSYIEPVRSSILKRFPILFSILTTFGVSTTFYGFEKVVDGIPVLSTHPFLMLILGMSILAFTGTLYKKLS